MKIIFAGTLLIISTIGLHFHYYESIKKKAFLEFKDQKWEGHAEEVFELLNNRDQQLLLNNTALNATANGIAITDRNGLFTWVNPAFTKITGYASIEVLGKRPSILKSGLQDDALYKELWNTIINGKVWMGVLINKRKDGTLYYEEQTITPVADENGGITHFIAVIQDITMRVKTQEALENRNQELIQLNQAISDITSSLSLDGIKQNIIKTVKQIIPKIYDATLQILDENNRLVTKTSMLKPIDQYPSYVFNPGKGAAGLAIKNRKTVNISDTGNDSRFFKPEDPPPFKSFICIPIIYKEKIFGTLSVEGKEINTFKSSEERLLKILVNYAASAIQNALYSENLEEMVEKRTMELRSAQEKLLAQQQIERELQLAVDIQKSLTPHTMPDLQGFSLAATALPAHLVSGDFYDFIIHDNETLDIVLADIAGKGIPAAMLTSTARSLYRISSEGCHTPANILNRVNTRLYDDLTNAGMFITMLSARLDQKNNRIQYANAGHTEALWWHEKLHLCSTIPVTGIPLGILNEIDLGEQEILLLPGDILLFYSDGITEAVNSRDQLFGVEQFKSTVERVNQLTPELMIPEILQEVTRFCDGVPLSDDITLIILKAEQRKVPFIFAAVIDQLEDISNFIRQFATIYGHEFAYQVDLATSEIITNIITHAYLNTKGDLRGNISLCDDRMMIDFYDEGARFDPAALSEIDLNEPHEGGYGYFITRQIMDVVDYTAGTPEGNHWHLEKYISDSKK